MEYTNKILQFSSIDKLKEEIVRDRTSKDILSQRYGTRFLMLNNFADYNEIFTFISKDLGVETLHLENLAYGDDKTITGDMLLSAIKKLKTSAILAPFSELVRFYSDEKFRGFFNEIILNEDINNPAKRIYIPIIGLHNRFTDFLKNFGRIAESAPIWQYYTTDDQVIVYITLFNAGQLPSKIGVKSIRTMKEWLKFWKTLAPVDEILCNAKPIKTGYKHSRPDSIFTFKPIENAYQFVTEFLNLDVNIPYKGADEKFWVRLIDLFTSRHSHSGHSLEGVIKEYFNKAYLDINAYIEMWANSNTEFDRWLLKNYGLTTHFFENNPYLKICVEETTNLNTPHELFGNIASRIFHLFTPAEQNQYANERLTLVSLNAQLFNENVLEEVKGNIEEDLKSIVTHDNNYGKAKKLITGVFEFEQLLSLGWYAFRDDKDFSRQDLQTFYPELYAYIEAIRQTTIPFSQKWIIDYFQIYKQSKLQDKYSPEILKYISEMNASAESFFDWFYALEDEHELLSAAINGGVVDKVYWIDGLGAEYLPYIEWLLKSTPYEIISETVARTGLPSNTKCNSFEVDNSFIFKIEDLDHTAHDSLYQRFNTLQRQLVIVKRIIDTIIRDNSLSYHSIAIVSDHGLSAMSRLVESKKLSNEAKHEGRYIKLDNGNYVDDPDYIIIDDKDGNKYKVALNHASLGKRPVREVHGGCTPEEVVVPFIIISNNPDRKKIDYRLNLISTKIPVSKPVVEIDILPLPSEVSIVIDGKKHRMHKGKYWSFKIDDAKEGPCNIVVIPSNGNPIQLTVNIYGLGASTNPFDDF